MKKLSLFIMIAAITMCSTVAMAWDSGNKQMRTIKGDYYIVGGGPCLVAPGGFNGILQPNSGIPGPWALSDSTWEGVYSFQHDGTGTFKAIYRVVEKPSYNWPPAPPGEPQPTGGDIPDVGAADITWKFHYTLSQTGRITFMYDKGTYEGEWVYGPQKDTPIFLNVSGPYYGVLSPDHLNILVTWGVPLQLLVTLDKDNEIPLFPLICNAVQQGFRCNKCPELVYTPDSAP